ncbi:MAG: MFS transporter, partial [Acidimicrobiia bacterium]
MSGDQPRSVFARPLLPVTGAILTVVSLVAFEGLAVAAALPQVAADLGSVALLPWMISGYLLTSGVAVIVAGPLIDSLGPRTMFRWAVGVFVMTSLLAALAPTMPVMIAARVAQGLGGGALIAVALAAVSLSYPDHLVGRAFAANSTVWGVMSVAGPAVAAFLITSLSWRWIFLVNVPLGGAAAVVGWGILPSRARPAGERLRLDWAGVALLTAFTTCTVLALSDLTARSLVLLGIAAVAGALYWRRASRTDQPVVRLRHVASQPFAGLGLAPGLVLAGAVGVHAYLPLYVQGGRGASPAAAAWSVLFLTLGWTIAANVVGRLMNRVSESGAVLSGYAIVLPCLTAGWVIIFLDGPLPLLLAVFLVVGVGIGTVTTSSLTLLKRVTPTDEVGRA